MRNKLLTTSQLEQFTQNGYLLLHHILDPAECQKFDQNIVQPALKTFADIDETDSNTWNTDILKSMATGDYNSDMPNILPGVMVRQPNGADPIADEQNLDLSALHPILDQLHGGIGLNGDGTKAWEWLHENVGWIHVRFPLEEDQCYEVNT